MNASTDGGDVLFSNGVILRFVTVKSGVCVCDNPI
jgi:hypothetical protein